jgi:hypothetical protein
MGTSLSLYTQYRMQHYSPVDKTELYISRAFISGMSEQPSIQHGDLKHMPATEWNVGREV